MSIILKGVPHTFKNSPKSNIYISGQGANLKKLIQ